MTKNMEENTLLLLLENLSVVRCHVNVFYFLILLILLFYADLNDRLHISEMIVLFTENKF